MGIINPKAVKEFLGRKLDSWDWMKRQSLDDVSSVVRDLSPRPQFGRAKDTGDRIKLWFHQKVCFLLMLNLQRFMLFLDMGGGKTLLVLMICKYLKKRGDKVRAIVFVPYVITADTWIEEAERWTDLKVVPLIGSGAENLHALHNTPDGELFIIAYQSAVAMMSKTVKNNKGKNVWTLSAATVRKHFKGFTLLAMDEIHKCKNVNSITYRMCRAISKMPSVEWAFGLTGTPFGKNLEDLWAQFFLIDHGETLGTTLGMFRWSFFSEVSNYWGGLEYRFKKRMMGLLEQMIKHRSIRFRIDECHDMPKKSRYDKIVHATADVAAYYDKIVQAHNDLSFGKISYRQVESTSMKLRQLASGFMTLKGNDASKVSVEFPVNPKLDALQDIIESMPDDSKMIIFHDFRFSSGLISKRLKQMKLKHARVWGEQTGKQNLAEIRKFKKDPSCRFLVINCQAGSSSQNLQVANYVVYFEQPRSSIDRQQSERRAWRPGQKKRVFFYDLIMKDTVDQKQFDSNVEGKDLLRSVLDGRTVFAKLR